MRVYELSNLNASENDDTDRRLRNINLALARDMLRAEYKIQYKRVSQ